MGNGSTGRLGGADDPDDDADVLGGRRAGVTVNVFADGALDVGLAFKREEDGATSAGGAGSTDRSAIVPPADATGIVDGAGVDVAGVFGLEATPRLGSARRSAATMSAAVTSNARNATPPAVAVTRTTVRARFVGEGDAVGDVDARGTITVVASVPLAGGDGVSARDGARSFIGSAVSVVHSTTRLGPGTGVRVRTGAARRGAWYFAARSPSVDAALSAAGARAGFRRLRRLLIFASCVLGSYGIGSRSSTSRAGPGSVWSSVVCAAGPGSVASRAGPGSVAPMARAIGNVSRGSDPRR